MKGGSNGITRFDLHHNYDINSNNVIKKIVPLYAHNIAIITNDKITLTSGIEIMTYSGTINDIALIGNKFLVLYDTELHTYDFNKDVIYSFGDDTLSNQNIINIGNYENGFMCKYFKHNTILIANSNTQNILKFNYITGERTHFVNLSDYGMFDDIGISFMLNIQDVIHLIKDDGHILKIREDDEEESKDDSGNYDIQSYYIQQHINNISFSQILGNYVISSEGDIYLYDYHLNPIYRTFLNVGDREVVAHNNNILVNNVETINVFVPLITDINLYNMKFKRYNFITTLGSGFFVANYSTRFFDILDMLGNILDTKEITNIPDGNNVMLKQAYNSDLMIMINTSDNLYVYDEYFREKQVISTIGGKIMGSFLINYAETIVITNSNNVALYDNQYNHIKTISSDITIHTLVTINNNFVATNGTNKVFILDNSFNIVREHEEEHIIDNAFVMYNYELIVMVLSNKSIISTDPNFNGRFEHDNMSSNHDSSYVTEMIYNGMLIMLSQNSSNSSKLVPIIRQEIEDLRINVIDVFTRELDELNPGNAMDIFIYNSDNGRMFDYSGEFNVDLFKTLYDNKEKFTDPLRKPFIIYYDVSTNKREEGIDANGLTAEMFQNLGSSIAKKFFTSEDINGKSYVLFKAMTNVDIKTQQELKLLGELFALAIKTKNRIPIYLHPLLLYVMITGTFDPLDYETLTKIIELYDEKLFDVYPFICFKKPHDHMNCFYNSGGENIDIDSMQQATLEKVNDILDEQKVAAVYFVNSFKSHFTNIPSLYRLKLSDLELIIAGINELTLELIYKHLNFVDMTSNDVQAFKEVINMHNTTDTYLKTFLRYITSSESIPAAGYGYDLFRIEKTEMFTTAKAQTCFNKLSMNPRLFSEYRDAEDKTKTDLYKQLREEFMLMGINSGTQLS